MQDKKSRIHDLEIPKENWVDFIRVLNRSAQLRPVRLEVIDREIGDQEMADKLPLEGIDYETKGSARGDLIISVESERGILDHRIEKPTHLYIAHDAAGELLETLAIQDAEGGETIVYFENLPALPEQIPEERPSAS